MLSHNVIYNFSFADQRVLQYKYEMGIWYLWKMKLDDIKHMFKYLFLRRTISIWHFNPYKESNVTNITELEPMTKDQVYFVVILSGHRVIYGAESWNGVVEWSGVELEFGVESPLKQMWDFVMKSKRYFSHLKLYFGRKQFGSVIALYMYFTRFTRDLLHYISQWNTKKIVSYDASILKCCIRALFNFFPCTFNKEGFDALW